MTTRRYAKAVRRGAAISAVALFASLPSFVSQTSAMDNVSIDRIGGIDRYDTARLLADRSFPDGQLFDIVLASGVDFPDALAGNAVAGTVGAPILLTAPGGLSTAAKDAINALKRTVPEQTTVHILGGTAAVSAQVETDLAALGVTVTRIAGANRYETAVGIARWIDSQVSIPNIYDGDAIGSPVAKSVFVATGENFPDALAAGPLAFDGPHPVLLVQQDTLPASVRQAIIDMQINHIVILGGESAVSAGVAAAIKAIDPAISVDRVAGTNRYQTAGKIADLALSNAFDFDGAEVLLASGTVFADALAGGPHGGIVEAPILLAGPGDAVPPATTAWLTAHSSTIGVIRALGGTARISAAQLDAARMSAQTVAANQQWTYAPELRSVRDLAGHPDTAEFVFDEDVVGQTPVAENFRLYDACGNFITPVDISIFGAVVRAEYAALVASATRAGVRYDGVEDVQGVPNLEAGAPFHDSNQATLGYLRQLVQVDNYQLQGFLNADGIQDISVDFHFSNIFGALPANLFNAGQYYILSNEGQTLIANNLIDLGDGNVRAFFWSQVQVIPELQLRRGFVTDFPAVGAVVSERYLRSDGRTVDPDLLSATIQAPLIVIPNNPVNPTLPGSQVMFEFDEAVNDSTDNGGAVLDPAQFGVFLGDGTVIVPVEVYRTARPGDGGRFVVAQFAAPLPVIPGCNPAATPWVSDAFVLWDAAQATDNNATANLGFNRPAQVTIDRPNSVLTPAGTTARPDLVSVTRTQNATTEDYTITYKFDQDVNSFPLLVAFDLYDRNGTQFRSIGVTNNPAISCGDLDSTTVCLNDANSAFGNDQMAASVVGGVEDYWPVGQAPASGLAGVTEGLARINP